MSKPIEEDLVDKKQYCVSEIQRLQRWLGSNKFHPRRKEFTLELQKHYDVLNKLKNERRKSTIRENEIFIEVVRKSFRREITQRIWEEVKRHKEEELEISAVNAYLDSDADILFEKYPAILKSNEIMKNEIRSLVKDLDSMIVDTKNISDNEEYHRIQNFNKTIIRAKSKLSRAL